MIQNTICKRRYLQISILLSLVSIAITLFINFRIAGTYLRVDGKTRALFGLTELLSFGYQYYIGLLGIIALIFAIAGMKESSSSGKKFIAVLLSLFAITFVFARTWRLFI